MRSYHLGLILILIVLSPLSTKNVLALENPQEFEVPTIPTFPTCENPQGGLVASYSDGTHGIPGDSGIYTGSDTVYTLTEDTLIQCFCAPNDGGIQTNWWKVSSLSFDQIEYLISLGWIYIPNGAEWGLDEAPYLAKNFNLDCREGDDGDDDDDDDDDDGDEDEDRRGSVLGAATGIGGQVLGLATTGNTPQILASLSFGLSSLAAAWILLKSKNDL